MGYSGFGVSRSVLSGFALGIRGFHGSGFHGFSRCRVFEVRGFWFNVSSSGFRGSGFLRLGISCSYFRCLGFAVSRSGSTFFMKIQWLKMKFKI